MAYNIKETKSCDLVVLGAGGSGLIAAVRAAFSGARVIILEKTDSIGGCMLYASGKGPDQQTFGSKWQAERGLPDTTADYVREKMDETFWRIDTKLAANAIRGTGEFFDWLCDIAPGTSDKFTPGRYIFDNDNGPIGPQKFSTTIENKPENGAGWLIVDIMKEKCAEYGVDILTGHRAVDIILENNKVVAAIAQAGEEYIRIDCGACLITTGSWIRNKDIMEKVCPELNRCSLPESAHNRSYMTGDGLAIAEKLGAAIDPDSFCIIAHGPGAVCLSQSLKNMSNSTYAIYVNLDGKRYVCEPPQARLSLFDSGVVQLSQPLGISYKVFDNAALIKSVEDAKKTGGHIPGFAYPPKFPDTMEGVYADIDESIAEHNGITFRANTIEELAIQLKIDPHAMSDTVDRYNQLCDEGFDWDYFKSPSDLIPIRTAPYYAVLGEFTIDGAYGGIKVDADMHITDNSGKIIDGLYAAGNVACGYYVNFCGVKKELITEMSWVYSSGFIAGTNCAKYLSQEK